MHEELKRLREAIGDTRTVEPNSPHRKLLAFSIKQDMEEIHHALNGVM